MSKAGNPLKIALFGGSFDPIHTGHVRLALEFAERLKLDKVLLMPTYVPPHKLRPDMAPAADRLEMCRLAALGAPVLDVSDLKGEEVKTGNVFFTLTPPDANVYIDGEKIDTSTYVTLEYGIHQMIVKASGYETISQYLKVGQENANLNVEMEPDGETGDIDGNEETDDTGNDIPFGGNGDNDTERITSEDRSEERRVGKECRL